MVIARPRLFSTFLLREHFYTFDPDKMNIHDFFTNTEKLIPYKDFFSVIENKTKNTKYKFTVTYKPIEYSISKSIIDAITLLNETKKSQNDYPKNYAIKKIKNIENYLVNIACDEFTGIKREGEIFINDQKISKFKIVCNIGECRIAIDGAPIQCLDFNEKDPTIGDNIIEELLDLYKSS